MSSVQVYVVGSPRDADSSYDRPFVKSRSVVHGLLNDMWNHRLENQALGSNQMRKNLITSFPQTGVEGQGRVGQIPEDSHVSCGGLSMW